jgi:nitroreductase/NAD-dependent dihydropyrimidine dehydrogenase PreA subunit
MLSFSVDQEKCSKCGECVSDCPSKVIAMSAEGYPAIAPENEAGCYRCQHCLAICPTAAVSILGLAPEQSQPRTGLPLPEQLEALIKLRRSVRRYQEEDLDPALIQRLLEVSWYAPTGVNARQVRFTVVDNRARMAQVRDEVMAGLGRLVRENLLPEPFAHFASIVSAWEEHGVDVIFRDAPHLLIASTPRQAPTPLADCLIALSYFDLYAQASDVGTLWGGLAKYAIDDLVPETRKILGIPEDHIIGYAMMFGRSAVQYPRGVQHAPALIHRV